MILRRSKKYSKTGRHQSARFLGLIVSNSNVSDLRKETKNIFLLAEVVNNIQALRELKAKLQCTLKPRWNHKVSNKNPYRDDIRNNSSVQFRKKADANLVYS